MSTNIPAGQLPANATIEPLIEALKSTDDATRWHARRALVALGQTAVRPLIDTLRDPDKRARWEAAQALTELADPSAAPALVETLGDDDNDVRWTAVDALIALKEHALVPLLEGLTHRSESVALRDSAHHVLKNMPLPRELTSTLAPVLDALEGPAPALQVPLIARRVLDTFKPA